MTEAEGSDKDECYRIYEMDHLVMEFLLWISLSAIQTHTARA